MSNISAAHKKEVREQYEGYPYPFRKPEEERERLVETIGANLDQVNAHCFEGRLRFGPGLRVLDAGGGTGDNTIYLAEQLRVMGGEVVYVDFSEASLAIAKERAAIRGLTNITFVHDSLLNAGKLEPFDFVVCSGVLHHLAEPEQGLAALKSVLKPEGAMLLMLYAQHGRTALYQLQEALRHLAPQGAMPDHERVRIARKVIDNLPPTHSFRLSEWYRREIEEYGDIAIYDMLLHAQDRAYTVPQIYGFLASAQMQLLGFLNVAGHVRPAFLPEMHFKDAELVERLHALPVADMQGAVELLCGSLTRHVFYTAPTPKRVPVPEEATLDYVPFITQFAFPPSLYGALAVHAAQHPTQAIRLSHAASGAEVEIPATPHLAGILGAMDGQKSLREVLQLSGASLEEFNHIFRVLSLPEWIFLRAPESAQVRFVDIRTRAA